MCTGILSGFLWCTEGTHPCAQPWEQLGDECSVSPRKLSFLLEGHTFFKKIAASCSPGEQFPAMENQQMFEKDTKPQSHRVLGFCSSSCGTPRPSCLCWKCQTLTQPLPRALPPTAETPRVICCPQEGLRVSLGQTLSSAPQTQQPWPSTATQSCC